MIDRPRFSTTRMREGYDVADVDATVDRVMASLEGDGATGITPAEIEQLRFTPVRLGAGYDMGEVDAWLDTVTAELDRRGSGAARTTAPIAEPMADPAPAAGAPAPSSPAAVQEVGGRIDLKVTALAMIGVVALVLVLAYVL